ncbi:MAG: hypothetical protein OXF83_05005 [Anaerolineaceae bacterium]|nr:hypothetical protein [Anaerolineaceae bacterium]MCY3936286.1 hypothetical protein [Chloroflexota bacterium]MCY4107217.1 hypothetical protein [Chloroflexota bacterium]
MSSSAKKNRFRPLRKLPRFQTHSADAQWMFSAGGLMMSVFVVRVLLRQGWRSLLLNRLRWLRFLRAFLRLLQLGVEIGSRPPRDED